MTKLPEGFTVAKKPAAKLPEGFTVTKKAAPADLEKQREQQLGREHWAQPWYKRVGGAVADLGRVGAQGLTLGWSDEIAAATQSAFGYDYDEALKARQQGIADSKSRMNYTTPHSGDVFEGLTSVPTVLASGGLGILGLGGAGVVSSVGHGEHDPAAIAAEAGLSALPGAGRYILRGAQKLAPSISQPLIDYGRSWVKPAVVSLFAGPKVAAASKYGAKMGGAGLRALEAMQPLRTDPGIVAQLAAAAARRGLED